MCLIAYSPKGAMIPRDVLAYACAQNGDGIGVMSSDGINKYLGKKALKRARRYIEKVLVPNNIPYAIHFRWATHGDVILKNVHPYITPDQSHWVMHNGVLGLTTAESSAEESDTAVYVRKYMAEELPDFVDGKLRYIAIENQIGYSNKFLIMDSSGQFKICNESAGTWIEENWYSNTYSLPQSFIPARKWPSYNNGHYHVYDGDYSPLSLGSRSYEDSYYSGSRRHPVMRSLPPAHKPINEEWNSEDRAAYYEALEAGMTFSEAQDYVDNGHKADTDHDDDGMAVITVGASSEAGELAAMRAIANTAQKEEAPIGGDFPENVPEDDDEEQSNFRKYLKKVAATVYAS